MNGMAGCANITRTSICVGDAHPASSFFIPAPKGQREKETRLFPLRINERVTILVPKEKCNREYAEAFRKKIKSV